MFYTNEGRDKGAKSCVCAFSNKFAVTYAHGNNRDLYARDAARKKGKKGKIFEVHSLVPEDGEPTQTVKVEVVHIDGNIDFIILEAIEGGSFLQLENDDENILENPKCSQQYLAVGSSTEIETKKDGKYQDPTFFPGTIINDNIDMTGRIVGDSITWPSDSGAGIFSKNYRLLGIMKGSKSPPGTNVLDLASTRCSIVPSWQFERALVTFVLFRIK